MTDHQLDQLLRERLRTLHATGHGNWNALRAQLDATGDGTDVDARLGAALHRLDAGSPAGWTSLSEQLDRTETLNFDATLGTALHHLDAGEATNWDRLSTRLDGVDNDDFDATLAGALGGLTAGAAAGWEALGAHLDELDGAETPFDETVRDRMQDYAAPDHPNHWPQMERELSRTFGLRQRIRRWRLVETALVALLLLALVGTFNNQDAFELDFPDFIERIWSTEPNNDPASEPVAALSEPAAVPVPPIADAGVHVPSNSETSIERTAQLPAAVVTPAAGQTERMEMEPEQMRELALPEKQLPALAAEGAATETPRETTERNGLLAKLGTLFPKKLKEEQQSLALKVTPRHEKPHLRVGMVSLGEFSLVDFQPADPDLKAEITQRSSKSYGYGGGLTLGFMYDRFEFETGAIYAFRTYSPNHTGRTFGSFNRYVQEWLRRVSYETVEIPANLRFNVHRKKNWRVYGGFGVSLNTVLTSTYDIKEIRSVALRAPGSGTPPPAGTNSAETQSTLADLIYPRGLLEGGDFWTNSYLTFNLNAGVEKYINPRISLYVQPSFAHSLRGRGYGPLQDRFDTFSLRLGTKVTVW